MLDILGMQDILRMLEILRMLDILRCITSSRQTLKLECELYSILPQTWQAPRTRASSVSPTSKGLTTVTWKSACAWTEVRCFQTRPCEVVCPHLLLLVITPIVMEYRSHHPSKQAARHDPATRASRPCRARAQTEGI
jgi:hypothetical protein